MSVPKKERKGKVEPTLVEPAFIEAIARVRAYGNTKYPDKDNWKGNPVGFYRDAAYRHWLQYLDGEYYDKESGEPHLSHCACNLMFVFFMEERDMKNTYQRLIQQTKEVQRQELEEETQVMGIEELNELKGWFVDLTENLLTPLGNGQYEPISPDNVRAILALIDAEVERQSVTDEYGYELGAYDVPYNFCPNCGRKIQGGTSK